MKINTKPVGASLLAKRECQSTSMQAGIPYSRAGSLPQWSGVADQTGPKPCWESRTCATDGQWPYGRFAGGWQVAGSRGS
ncbi:hypothetical protein DKY63_13770 [Pseudomonas putida]|uniref:Uncharacterized protein n=1 Tax=Pseudomonas putida TaxID=303 RepID=A0A2Z4RIX4_PSEPU|nr:hypothetical protein DKY63_13770 [Pseudomonas putida]